MLNLRRSCFALCAVLLFVLSSPCLFAKDSPVQVLMWPESGTPVLQFNFAKFQQVGWNGKQRVYVIDTEVKNLSAKVIDQASFDLYLFDKNNVRIGDGWVTVNNAAPGDVIKFETNVSATGQPATVRLAPHAPKSISLTVNSVPQGAHFTLDGKEEGNTPKEIVVNAGTHLLEFDKEGFNHGKYPFAVGPNDVSGGNVSYELGTSAHDTVELRDGTILSGDVLSVTSDSVVVKIAGEDQTLKRNLVKRIMLVPRDSPDQ